MIGLAPALDPIVDPEKPEVSPRKIEPELSQQAFLDRANSILRDPKRHADASLGDWTSDLPAEENLVDNAAGTPVRWVEGTGWVRERQ
jgi:hypothetical protein